MAAGILFGAQGKENYDTLTDTIARIKNKTLRMMVT
jgi:hypothetical protein